MISPKLLQSNVLRRIYKDSCYQASTTNAEARSAKLAGNTEAAERFYAGAAEFYQLAQLCSNELQERKESLN